MTKELKFAITAVVTILILWIVSGFIVYNQFDSWADRGTFGDMFGGINALFSGIALVGVVYAIILQQKELKMQREELEANRKELMRSAEAQEKSEKALQEQNKAYYLTVRLSALSSMLSHFDNQSQSESGIKQRYGYDNADKIIEEMKSIIENLKEIE